METTTQIEKQEYDFRFYRKHTIWYTCPITVTAESEEQAKRMLLSNIERMKELEIYDEIGYLSDCADVRVIYGEAEWQHDTVENCDDESGGLEICYDDGLHLDPFYSSK